MVRLDRVLKKGLDILLSGQHVNHVLRYFNKITIQKADVSALFTVIFTTRQRVFYYKHDKTRVRVFC